MNTRKKLKNTISIASLIISLVVTQNSNARSLSDYTTLEKAQFATSILRAPFGIIQNFSSQAKTSGKIAKILASAIRLSDDILAILNADANKTMYRTSWIAFDALKINSSVFELTQDMPELEIDTQTEQSIMSYLNQAHKVLLPCAESAAAIMAAYYNHNRKETARDKINIRQYQSLISLSRTLSEFLKSEKNSYGAKIWAAILVANTLCSLYHWTIEKAPVAAATTTRTSTTTGLTPQERFVQNHVQQALAATNNIVYDDNGIHLQNNIIAVPGQCTVCLEEFRTQNNPEDGVDIDQSHIVATCNDRHLMHTECFAGIVYHAQNSWDANTDCPQCRQDMNNPHYYRLVHQ